MQFGYHTLKIFAAHGLSLDDVANLASAMYHDRRAAVQLRMAEARATMEEARACESIDEGEDRPLNPSAARAARNRRRAATLRQRLSDAGISTTSRQSIMELQRLCEDANLSSETDEGEGERTPNAGERTFEEEALEAAERLGLTEANAGERTANVNANAGERTGERTSERTPPETAKNDAIPGANVSERTANAGERSPNAQNPSSPPLVPPPSPPDPLIPPPIIPPNNPISPNPSLAERSRGGGKGENSENRAEPNGPDGKSARPKSEQADSPRSQPAANPRFTRFIRRAGMAEFPSDLGAYIEKWDAMKLDYDRFVLPTVQAIADEYRSRTGRTAISAKFFNQGILDAISQQQAEIEAVGRQEFYRNQGLDEQRERVRKTECQAILSMREWLGVDQGFPGRPTDERCNEVISKSLNLLKAEGFDDPEAEVIKFAAEIENDPRRKGK